jgi:hypothetical protein
MLRALGAEVTVYVRRPQVKEAAEAAGFRAVLLGNGTKILTHLLFGTVPAPAENLTSLTVDPKVTVYDLGGGLPETLTATDSSLVKVLPLRGAPGVFAPLAAGEIYGGAVLDFINRLERRTTT